MSIKFVFKSELIDPNLILKSAELYGVVDTALMVYVLFLGDDN